jgi:hypothetical protein
LSRRLLHGAALVPPWPRFVVPLTPPVHLHAARRLHFSANSDGSLLWLSQECWGRGLVRLAELLDDLLIERQTEQSELPADPVLDALLPF